jgi:hypothetical protein
MESFESLKDTFSKFPDKTGIISFEGTLSNGYKVVAKMPADDIPPYPIITYEPYLSQAYDYLRPTDYALIAGITFGPPAAFVALERHRPSISYRLIPKSLMIQIPTYFLIGVTTAMKLSIGI